MIGKKLKKATIIGAVIGDTIGSVYEFNPTKDYNFNLFDDRMEYTDDSIITIAVADWILHDHLLSQSDLAKRMRKWGNKYPYPMGSYGGTFSCWLSCKDMVAYNSWGNGAAMRVSPVGFAFDTLEETLRIARISAEVTHNHPEGIKGAQATAACIFLARTGKSKEEIKDYIEKTFGYNLSRTCDEIRPSYKFDESCQGTVPESIIAFLDSTDFDSAIRLAVSLGGDADTMGAITGSIAEAYYGGVPEHIRKEVIKRLPIKIIRVMQNFYHKFMEK